MNPAHLDYDVLADLAEGLLEDDEAASVNAHLDTCADCRDLSADLADVSRILAEAPAPSIPAELAERIDTAIAAESLNNATVVSMEQRRGRRHWRILSAAAAAVIVAGGGAAVGSVALGGADGNDGATTAPAQDNPKQTGLEGVDPKVAAPSAAPEFKVYRSRTDYRAGTLGAQVEKLLDGRRKQGAGEPPGTKLRGCVYGVTKGQAPALVDQADYEGNPAIVIATRAAESGTWNVWVVGPDCSAGDQHVLKTLKNV
ncbi:zf-HC2 domain-containing protein [Spirillospora sp. NPDC048819]|uniref:anti-sigma factor family protein n=1 Tax=Spirillospora sp. NPDC048819 TaxID=3155268 RepID=UPI0033D165F2